MNGRWRGEGGKADAGGKGQEAVVGTGKVAGGVSNKTPVM